MNIQGTPENDRDKIALLCFEKIKQMYSKDYSEIWNIFYGIQVSQLVSVETNKVMSMTPEPFFIINLPIPSSQTNKSPSLSDCFDLYVEGEILDGDNCVLNELTGIKEAARKNLTFWSLPTILVIDIKRYNVSNRKNQILVDFPLTDLNLSKYVIGYNKESYIYDLYGVCNHGGSVLGGHYTSYVKNANGKWYHYNDTSVTEVPEQIQKQQIVSPKAYCFFYRKRAIK
jgi:ubiquitin C-terminal hydrolase